MHTIEFLLIFLPLMLVVGLIEALIHWPGRTPADPE